VSLAPDAGSVVEQEMARDDVNEITTLRERVAKLEAALDSLSPPPAPQAVEVIESVEPPRTRVSYMARTPDAVMSVEEQAAEMERRGRRMQQEIERRRENGNKSRLFHKRAASFQELQALNRIELEDYAMEIGLLPRAVLLETDALRGNIMSAHQAWIEAILED